MLKIYVCLVWFPDFTMLKMVCVLIVPVADSCDEQSTGGENFLSVTYLGALFLHTSF